MSQFHEAGEPGVGGRGYRYPEEELVEYPACPDEGASVEATEGNGTGRKGKGDGERLPDPRPDPDREPGSNGRQEASGTDGTGQRPHFMPSELARPWATLLSGVTDWSASFRYRKIFLAPWNRPHAQLAVLW
jgi:hypothetical protein